jgi:hypothetical protein
MCIAKILATYDILPLIWLVAKLFNKKAQMGTREKEKTDRWLGFRPLR